MGDFRSHSDQLRSYISGNRGPEPICRRKNEKKICETNPFESLSSTPNPQANCHGCSYAGWNCAAGSARCMVLAQFWCRPRATQRCTPTAFDYQRCPGYVLTTC